VFGLQHLWSAPVHEAVWSTGLVWLRDGSGAMIFLTARSIGHPCDPCHTSETWCSNSFSFTQGWLAIADTSVSRRAIAGCRVDGGGAGAPPCVLAKLSPAGPQTAGAELKSECLGNRGQSETLVLFGRRLVVLTSYINLHTSPKQSSFLLVTSWCSARFCTWWHVSLPVVTCRVHPGFYPKACKVGFSQNLINTSIPHGNNPRTGKTAAKGKLAVSGLTP
jgi:hypothetical protein